ncbi:trimethylamine:corrinoid methyltransferase [Desulfosporosinus orientis DSM 765]|uniref:Trimethylamine:corrinoid methyltransferase n=1 Tax=Desulfosporosinus orientis (strain ATCC 19365 / DSM 765 / NCIMB 8382 / VKM B-1628 / Singapore I) TaxID=768706 RepID=G7W6Y1_DESOD|nr:trimethylamine methyltransferase family protein [Desulfosporosinus orientis]AET69838.1 trimethylamine:corrinoid methyltransferase [Desulfosporosinus orientis DSM 765]
MNTQSIESNYKGNQTLQFKVLSDKQCEKIVNAALEILERTGVNIYSEEALTLLKKANCQVDGIMVRIPSYLIKKALTTVPSRIVLCDRNGQRKLFLEGNNSYFGPGPTCPNFLDVETGERRRTVKRDVVNTSIVADALPNVDFVMSLSMISDCTLTLADIHEVHAMLQNTTKPIVGWTFNVEAVKDIIDMCSTVAGSLTELQRNPFIVIYSEPTTPLTHTKDALEKLLFMAENNLPVIYTPGMVLGGTAPITIAGALAVGVADNLTGLLLSQLKREGAPFIAAAPGGPMDMKTMQHCYGAPEFSLVHAASADIFHYLNLPIWSAAGASDSKIVDAQAAAEAAFQIFASASSGAHLIHDVGFLDSGLTGSLEQLVLGDEIIGMVRRFIKGVEIDEDHLALEVIHEVGPGGQFITAEHTYRYFKQELWTPTLLDREVYSNWENNGNKSLTDRANEKAKKILREHRPEPLSQKVLTVIDNILENAEQRMKR